MKRSFLNCHHYALMTVILWATSYICNKIVLESFTSMSVGVWRTMVGAAVLGAAALLWRRPAPPPLRDVPWFFLSGLLGLALYFFLFAKGAGTLGPTTSCIIIATTPIITALLATVFYDERLPWTGWAAIGLAFCGILVLSLWDGTLSLNAGILWTQLAAVIMALYNIVQRRMTRTYPSLDITTYSFFASALMLAFFLPAAARQAEAAPPWQFWTMMYMGIFPSAAAYLLWGKAISIAPKTSYVTNYMFLTPFFAGIMEYIWKSRPPDTGTLAGGALILGGLALFSLAGKK